jgi:hypothetical protein
MKHSKQREPEVFRKQAIEGPITRGWNDLGVIRKGPGDDVRLLVDTANRRCIEVRCYHGKPRDIPLSRHQ